MDSRLKYVSREALPSGGWRYRFRKNGVKVTLDGEPGQPAFHAHYARLLHGRPKPVEPVEGSISWLVVMYLENLAMRVKAGQASDLTLKGHRSHLGKLVAHYGTKDANMPRGKMIELRDKLTETPGAADNLLKAVSALYKWAIERNLVHVGNPTRDVGRLNRGSAGFPAWEAADFTRYTDTHPAGSKARLALALAIATTARRGDLVLIGKANEFERDGRRWIGWRQAKKPHRLVELPMTQALIEATKGLGTPYLVTDYGKPFTNAGFGNRFKMWCAAAKVDKTLHGVRKGIPSLLTGHGPSSLELDVLLGHEMNSEETKVYVVNAERAALAVAIIDRLDRLVL
jgi:integrase